MTSSWHWSFSSDPKISINNPNYQLIHKYFHSNFKPGIWDSWWIFIYPIIPIVTSITTGSIRLCVVTPSPGTLRRLPIWLLALYIYPYIYIRQCQGLLFNMFWFLSSQNDNWNTMSYASLYHVPAYIKERYATEADPDLNSPKSIDGVTYYSS